ncbi:hypothetical protein CsSME_00031654 [Camellia sinensis var. sinensis]
MMLVTISQLPIATKSQPLKCIASVTMQHAELLNLIYPVLVSKEKYHAKLETSLLLLICKDIWMITGLVRFHLGYKICPCFQLLSLMITYWVDTYQLSLVK